MTSASPSPPKHESEEERVAPKDEIAELDDILWNFGYPFDEKITSRNYNEKIYRPNKEATKAAILSLKDKWQAEAKESATKLYQKELEHWKRTAELFLEREQTKLPEHVFCSGCGKKLMEGKSLKLNDQSSKLEGGDSE